MAKPFLMEELLEGREIEGQSDSLTSLRPLVQKKKTRKRGLKRTKPRISQRGRSVEGAHQPQKKKKKPKKRKKKKRKKKKQKKQTKQKKTKKKKKKKTQKENPPT